MTSKRALIKENERLREQLELSRKATRKVLIAWSALNEKLEKIQKVFKNDEKQEKTDKNNC